MVSKWRDPTSRLSTVGRFRGSSAGRPSISIASEEFEPLAGSEFATVACCDARHRRHRLHRAIDESPPRGVVRIAALGQHQLHRQQAVGVVALRAVEQAVRAEDAEPGGDEQRQRDRHLGDDDGRGGAAGVRSRCGRLLSARRRLSTARPGAPAGCRRCTRSASASASVNPSSRRSGPSVSKPGTNRRMRAGMLMRIR